MSRALVSHFETKLAAVKRADPLALISAVREFAEAAAVLIRDHENEIAALKREVATARRPDSVVM